MDESRPDWQAADVFEWTYERDEGDLVVFARTALEALETIRHHGMLITDPSKIKMTGGMLTDYLKKEGIQ